MSRLAVLGGKPECRITWPTWPVFDKSEERGLLRVLRSGKWWKGANVAEFERRFAAFQGARYAVTTNSGTTALEAAVSAAGIGPGDEVIVPAYTFIATASPVVRAGAVPVFGDIEPTSMCLDPRDVKRKLSRRTKAIIPVHFAGHVADMDGLRALARPRGIALIEDACHAWGSRWRGKGAGTLGACGAFSFQISKNITAGEGGMLVTDHADVAARAVAFTHAGRRAGRIWYEHFTPATNARMTEFSAAVLLAQLARLPRQTARRQANARILDRGLASIPGLQPQGTDRRHGRRSFHFYAFRIDQEKLDITREAFLRALSAEGVPGMGGWQSLDRNPLFTGKDGGAGVPSRGGPCPVSDQVTRDCVWITHTVLLAPASAMRAIVRAAAKVVERRAELR